MDARLETGVPHLDELMGGGLIRGGLHLVAGDPGSGKTVLAHQIAASVAGKGGQALYLTTLVELHETFRKQASGFRFFRRASLGESLYYCSVYPAFAREGFEGIEGKIRSLLREHDPTLLILDGLHVLKDAASDTASYNHFIAALQAQASSTGTTSIIISNRNPGEPADGMYTISDAVLLLETLEKGPSRLRGLEIRKMRTSAHAPGRHTFEVTGDGIEIQPRLEATVIRERAEAPRHPPAEELHGFRVDGLNEMLGGGVGRRSATLVAGATGTGKTSLALSYLAEGFEKGEAGVFLGFHEEPDRVVAKGEGLSLPLGGALGEGRARVIWHSSAEVPTDRLAHRLLEEVRALGATRVVIDSIDDLVRPLAAEERSMGFVNALLDNLRGRGVGTLLTMELPDVLSLDVTLPMAELSTSADNILLLRSVESRSELGRIISVLKVRDREAETSLREFLISSQGLRVGGRFTSAGRLLRPGDVAPDPGESGGG